MEILEINTALLDALTEQAKASPWLRMNYDLRNSAADTSQRMLNAIEPGSVVPIHRHQKTSETVVMLRGRIVEEFYDELERICSATYEVSPNGPICALNIPAGTWHTLRSLESGTVILEMKDGAYEPIAGCDVMGEAT
ncbi:MAG: WbuC family cupin fold metalloprotein [Prevotella sp.]|nr:WbuC family cupin fold metalloprotein [Prevotella sp.]